MSLHVPFVLVTLAMSVVFALTSLKSLSRASRICNLKKQIFNINSFISKLTYFSSADRAGLFDNVSSSLRAALISLGSLDIDTDNGSAFNLATAGILGFIND